MRKELKIYVDGACKGNPGEAGIGVVIMDQEKKVSEISRAIGNATNNIAEYTALIWGLQEALILKAVGVKIFTDSELVAKQVSGQYKIKNEQLKPLFDQVQHLLGGFKKAIIHHIPREQNKEADKLATESIKKKQADVVASAFRLK